MNVMKKLNELEQYLGFNIFTIGGWLYFPALIYMLTFKHPYHYIWLPLCIYLLIPWFISTIAFLIFLVEQIISPKEKNKFFQNMIYKIFSRIGLIIILIFYVLFILKSLIP